MSESSNIYLQFFKLYDNVTKYRNVTVYGFRGISSYCIHCRHYMTTCISSHCYNQQLQHHHYHQQQKQQWSGYFTGLGHRTYTGLELKQYISLKKLTGPNSTGAPKIEILQTLWNRECRR